MEQMSDQELQKQLHQLTGRINFVLAGQPNALAECAMTLAMVAHIIVAVDEKDWDQAIDGVTKSLRNYLKTPGVVEWIRSSVVPVSTPPGTNH